MKLADNRKEYHRNYYAKRKEEIAERKKRLYHEDEQVRQQYLDRSKRNRLAKKQERDLLIKEGIIPKRKKRKHTDMYVDINGKQYRGYTVREFAAKINCSISTINKWCYDKVLPKTPFVSGNLKLYTESMIYVVTLALKLKIKRLNADGTSPFYDYIIENWRDLPGFVDKD